MPVSFYSFESGTDEPNPDVGIEKMHLGGAETILRSWESYQRQTDTNSVVIFFSLSFIKVNWDESQPQLVHDTCPEQQWPGMHFSSVQWKAGSSFESRLSDFFALRCLSCITQRIIFNRSFTTLWLSLKHSLLPAVMLIWTCFPLVKRMMWTKCWFKNSHGGVLTARSLPVIFYCSGVGGI